LDIFKSLGFKNYAQTFTLGWETQDKNKMLKSKMSKNLWATTLLAVLVCVFIGMSVAGMTSAEIIKINGTVNDFYGPVGDAEIKVYDAQSYACETNNCPSADVLSLQPIKTNANGNFQILINVSYEKTYNITVKKEKYENTTRQITLNNNSRNLSLEIDIRGITKVEGVVVDAESGMIVKNAEVNILDKGYRTGDNGYFIFQNVSAETHTITIIHDDYETQSFVYDIPQKEKFRTIKISKTWTTKDYAARIYSNFPSIIIGYEETKKFNVYVQNIGTKDATFEIQLLDTQQNFKYRILSQDNNEINKIFVQSGKTGNFYIEVKTPENINIGEYKFRVKAGSESPAELTLITKVTAGSTGTYFFDVSSMYRGKAVKAGSEVKFEINLNNNQSADTFRLNAGVPDKWKYYITNTHGEEITEVEVTKDYSLNLLFKVNPPADEEKGTYKVNISIMSVKGRQTKTLNFEVNVRQEKEISAVEISSPYSTKSAVVGEAIEYSVSIGNDGRVKDNYNLFVEELPAGWTYKFKEGSGNSPQVQSVEVDTGATKSVVLQVNPSTDTTIGEYKFKINVYGKANATLNASILILGSNEMKLRIDDLWVTIEAGQEKETIIKVQNTGLSELRDVELDVTKPTGWEISLVPRKIVSLPPQTTGKFTLKIRPPVDAGLSDYKIIIKAKSAEVETPEDQIRVTISKSSQSSWLGYAIIGIGIILVVVIFKKFGRK